MTGSISGTIVGQAGPDQATVPRFRASRSVDTDVAATETVTVTVSNTANGALSNLGGFIETGSGIYTYTGGARGCYYRAGRFSVHAHRQSGRNGPERYHHRYHRRRSYPYNSTDDAYP
jgi:hypothetical protein